MVKRRTVGLSHFPQSPGRAPRVRPRAIPERQRKMFTKFSIWNHNTELCIDLKTILTSDRRPRMRKDYTGVLTHDGTDHFRFVEDVAEKGGATVVSRNPIVYAGACINVHRRDDGLLYPTFRHPQLSTFYTFRDFCREAAEELLMMAGLGEKNEKLKR